LEKSEQQMRSKGENENTLSAFILKTSRKLRDFYLSGLAQEKVTFVTVFFFLSFLLTVCVHGKDTIVDWFA